MPRVPAAPGAFHLLYKVVELSTVDEGSLERTLNEWTPQGWNLDGIQFAMREASKRPAMAFVFFTREVPVPEEREEREALAPSSAGDVAEARSDAEVRGHLARLAGDAPSAATTTMIGGLPRVDPHTRLAQLAGLVDDPGDGEA